MKIVNPIGKKGEDLAVQFLKDKGWKILERNYRKHYGEIDIVAIDPGKPSTSFYSDESSERAGKNFSLSEQSESKGKTLVFVEVKTRTSNEYGTPLESITSWKLKPLLKTIQLYVAQHKNLPESLRLDAISVILDGELKMEKIEHVENISVS